MPKTPAGEECTQSPMRLFILIVILGQSALALCTSTIPIAIIIIVVVIAVSPLSSQIRAIAHPLNIHTNITSWIGTIATSTESSSCLCNEHSPYL